MRSSSVHSTLLLLAVADAALLAPAAPLRSAVAPPLRSAAARRAAPAVLKMPWEKDEPDEPSGDAAEKKRNVALLEETRARKEHLKKTDQNNFDAILQCTAEIKSLELLLRRMTRRLAEPQQWCPRCLNNHFELAA